MVVLCEFAKSHPRSSLDDATRDLRERCEVDVCSKTVRKALQAAGITRVKPPRQAASDAQNPEGQAKRYGCTSAHRRQATHGPVQHLPDGRRVGAGGRSVQTPGR